MLYARVDVMMRTPKPEKVVEAVCIASGFTEEELYGSSRKQEIVFARRVACYLLKTLCMMSYPQIGRMMHTADHTAPLYHVQQAHRMIRAKSVKAAQFKKLLFDANDNIPLPRPKRIRK